MRLVLLSSAFLLVLVAPSQAQQPAPSKAGESYAQPIVPLIKLEGSTTGKATVNASVDYVRARDRSSDLRATAAFQASASNGLINLISTSTQSQSSAWQVGLVVTTVQLPDLINEPSDVVTPSQRDAAAKLCANACTPDDKTTFCVRLRDETTRELKKTEPVRQLHMAAVQASEAATAALEATPAGDLTIPQKKAEAEAKKADAEAKKVELDMAQANAARKALDLVAQDIDALSFCPSGKEVFKKAEVLARDVRLRYPTRIWSGGVAFGRTQHKFLLQGDDQTFTVDTMAPAKWAMGLAVTSVDQKLGYTIEGQIRADSAFESQSKTAKWCVPAGTVMRPDESGSDVAETCDEQPLGKPVRKSGVKFAAYVGAISLKDGKWRIAGGPIATYSITEAKEDDNPYEVGFEIPLYLSLALSKLGYQGLVRITPTFVTAHASDGTEESKFTLSVALLGDRSMFGLALQ